MFKSQTRSVTVLAQAAKKKRLLEEAEDAVFKKQRGSRRYGGIDEQSARGVEAGSSLMAAQQRTAPR
jgi:hypothetical protein